MPAAMQTTNRPALSDLTAAAGTSLVTRTLNCTMQAASGNISLFETCFWQAKWSAQNCKLPIHSLTGKSQIVTSMNKSTFKSKMRFVEHLSMTGSKVGLTTVPTANARTVMPRAAQSGLPPKYGPSGFLCFRLVNNL